MSEVLYWSLLVFSVLLSFFSCFLIMDPVCSKSNFSCSRAFWSLNITSFSFSRPWVVYLSESTRRSLMVLDPSELKLSYFLLCFFSWIWCL